MDRTVVSYVFLLNDRKAYIVLGTLEFGGKMIEITCPYCNKGIEIIVRKSERSYDVLGIVGAILLWLDRKEFLKKDSTMIYSGSVREFYGSVACSVKERTVGDTMFTWFPIYPNRLMRVLRENIKPIEKYGYMIDERNGNIKIYRIGEIPNEY